MAAESNPNRAGKEQITPMDLIYLSYIFSLFGYHDISSLYFLLNNWLDKHIFPAWMYHAWMVEF
jgi:hypothetical protein